MSEQDFSPISITPSQSIALNEVIPLMEEQLEVGKRVVSTGTVRLRKHTEERTETIEVPLTSVQWRVEHVSVNQVVPQVPAIRQEGETTVYPVVEERVTIFRELVLLEEVRVTRSVATKTEVSEHVLRREQIAEERTPDAIRKQASSSPRAT